MLIPSIDLMGGKIVQLVQGQRKALEFENFGEWVARFSPYPVVQLVDLDAAMGNGSNRALVAEFCGKLPCQVGGGIRSISDAQAVLDCGAKKVIIGSSLINMPSQTQENRAGSPRAKVNTTFARSLCERFGAERLVFAVDARGGRVAIHGWKTITDIEPAAMMQQLEPFCSAFLYTHIDTEGLLKGIPMDVIRNLRQKTSRQLIAAGGICRSEEIAELNNIGVDAVVGMAIYSGLIAI
ncbi:MAG: 1-(5-phosphoribosyl)-5-[(5-phosphoribosylamino)methylideneamino] imidazole-4-carboxamide isomerase [Candidatus Korobacteraceae bacterium]|jgi:phosphoribosylformimino-5-aminoimidazole carboxamide ribotide isomerase